MGLINRISPIFSLIFNRVRYPALHCGVLVELPSLGSFFVGSGVRIGALTRIYLDTAGSISLGQKVNLGRNVHLQTSAGHIKVGINTSIQDNCRLYGDVTIGQGCLLAPNVYISSGVHAFDCIPHLPIQLQEQQTSVTRLPIKIEDDCWIGINAVIMPGIEISKGSIIGAGAIVTKNVPPYSIVAGVPARVIKKRLEFSPPSMIDATREEDWPYFYSGFCATELRDKNRHGFTVEGPFVLALDHPSPTQLIIHARALSQKAELGFLEKMRQLRNEEEVIVFNLPRDQDHNLRYSLQTLGVVQIRIAKLV